jgi:ureidoacrylate peracid hydrolase
MDHERIPLARLVDPAQTAVLVIDVQPLFTERPLAPPLPEVLPRLRAFLDAARACGVARVFIRHVIPAERWTEVWQDQHAGRGIKEALAPGSPLSGFAPGFEPEPDDLIVLKQRYSGFVGTELAPLLRERGIRTVVLVGLTTDVCVSSTARDAFHHEFHTVTLADCTAERTLERHEAGLATLAGAFGRVCGSEEVLAAWEVEIARTGATR